MMEDQDAPLVPASYAQVIAYAALENLTLKVDNPALKTMGGEDFKAETVPLASVAKNMTKVQQMLDRVGFK